MKIVLSVSSSYQHDTGGCEVALIELTSELASLALGRIAALRELRRIFRRVLFRSMAQSLWRRKGGGETEETGLADMLDELESKERGSLSVPAHFEVPPSQVAAV